MAALMRPAPVPEAQSGPETAAEDAEPPQVAPALDPVPQPRPIGLRRIGTDNLRRVETAPRNRPDTRLKRQQLNLKTPPKT